MDKIDLDKICSHISNCERKAQKASRDSIKYKQVEYMESRVGHVFESVVTSTHEFGFFVEITENGCDCLCRLNDVSGDWVYNTKNKNIQNQTTKQTISIGDNLMVKIKSTNVDLKSINATLVF